MQTDEIINRFEELEKQISFSKKQDAIDISNLETSMDNLQSFRKNATERIVALDSATSSLMTSDAEQNDAIINLQTRLSEIEDNCGDVDFSTELAKIETNIANISANATKIDNLESLHNELSATVETISANDSSQTTSISNLNSSLNDINEDISDLTTQLTTQQTELHTAKTKISNLESAIENMEQSGGSTDLPETFNFYNKVIYKQNQEAYGNFENFFTLFFLCEQTSLCKIKFKANIQIIHESEHTTTMNVFLNDEIINTNQYSTTGTEDNTIEFEYEFMPTQKNNNIIFKSTEKNAIKKTFRVLLKECKIEIYGRNVLILNKDNSFLVFPCQDTYYLTKNVYDKGYGKIMQIGESNWNENFVELPRMLYGINDADASASDKYCKTNFNYTYFPYATYNSTTDKYDIDNTNYGMACAFSSNHNSYFLSSDLIPIHFANIKLLAQNENYTLGTPGESSEIGRAAYYVKYSSDYCLCLYPNENTNLTNQQFKLNGEVPNKRFAYCAPVNYKDWVDNPNHTYSCIGIDEFGNNIFFPQRLSTYTLDLGVGSQTTAFGQSNGSINVYMSIANKIFKKVLSYNSTTSKYELTSTTFVDYGNEYIEGIQDDYFIKKGEMWTYIPPTTTTN